MASSKPPTNGASKRVQQQSSGVRRQSGKHCPICKAPAEQAYWPFCSRRCADVDLSRWLRGGYAIPSNIETDEDGDDSIAASEALRAKPQPGSEPED